MTTPIHWGTYGGDFLERVMAAFLAQDTDGVQHREPASGDGGIDIFVRVEEGIHVVQVKGFHGRIGASEKRQIAHSWQTLVEDPRTSKEIVSWTLTCPTNMTPDEEVWFDDLTKDAVFETLFKGKPYWDALASDNPALVDHFFFAGRERLRQRADRLMGAFTSDDPVTAEDVAAWMDVVRAQLSADDPFYSYDIISSGQSPKGKLMDCVLQETRALESGGFATICVVPKNKFSTADFPIRGTMVLRAPSPEMQAEFEEGMEGFLNFGRALGIEVEVAEFSATGPLGIGGEFQGGTIELGAATVEEFDQSLRLAIDDGDSRLAELGLVTQSVTVGPKGGAEILIADKNSILAGSLTISPEKDGRRAANLHITVEFEGRPAQHALPVARFLSAALPARSLSLLPEFGDTALLTSEITSSDLAVEEIWVQFMDRLLVFQRFSREPVLVPGELDGQLLVETKSYADAIEGADIERSWTDLSLDLRAGVSRASFLSKLPVGGSALIIEREDFWEQDDGSSFSLGRFRHVFKSVTPDPKDRRAASVRLLPGPSDEWRLSWLGLVESKP